MELVFLIYGLAFFLLGFAILYYPKKTSVFQLAGKIQWVGWFGIIHGVNEWLDLLILIRALDVSFVWESLRLMTLPVSFLALVYFGSQVISTQKKSYGLCKLLTPVLFVLWAVLFWTGEHTQERWDILSRYVLCFPGAVLTGFSLFLYVPETKIGSYFRLSANLKIAGIAFLAYALLAGLIVKDAAFFPASILNYSLFSKSLGIPVQVFRSLCAAIIAYNLIRVLEVFRLEVQHALSDSQMRFRTVVNAAPVTLFMEDSRHCITFMEGKALSDFTVMPSDAVGKPTSEVFAALPPIYQGSRRAFSLGEEIRDLISNQGRFYEVFFAPFKDSMGGTCGAIGVVIDVSEQKNAQTDIEKYRAEMEKNKTLAAIGALSSEIAGEIAGPLYESKLLLLKALGGLRRTIGAGDIKTGIQDGLDKISGTIKTLDGFCAKANLQTSPQPEPIDLFEIVQRVLSVFRESAQHAMVRITTDGAEIFPVMRVSSRELEQVLYIMIQNVIQSADGTHVHNLDINFSTQQKMFCVKFSENCLCDSVQKAKKAAAIGSEILAGTDERSFGFSILKGIVNAYAGSITITPNPQAGVLYEIQLPLAT